MDDSVKIFVIDDDYQDIKILKYHLDKIESFKSELSSCQSWREAQDKSDFKNADLLILDYMIGIDDGSKILREIRGSGDKRPIIFLTGQGDEKLAAKLIRDGADDYLVKSEINNKTLGRSIYYAIEKREVSEALRENEERLQDFLDNANDLIQFIDPDGKILYVNKKWYDIMKYSDQDINKMLVYDVIKDSYIETCMEHFQQVFNGKRIDNFDVVFISKDGKEIFLDGNASCRFEDGKAVYARCIFRDITAKRKAEEEKKQAEISLEQVKTAHMLAATIAHEFNNPLAIMRLSIEMMRMKSDNQGNFEEEINKLNSSISRMNGLVEDLLALHQIEEIDYAAGMKILNISRDKKDK